MTKETTNAQLLKTINKRFDKLDKDNENLSKDNENLAIITKKEFEKAEAKNKIRFDGVNNRLDKVENRLGDMEQELYYIKNEVKSIREKIDNIELRIAGLKKASNEDVLVLNREMEKLKKKVAGLISKVKILETQKA